MNSLHRQLGALQLQKATLEREVRLRALSVPTPPSSRTDPLAQLEAEHADHQRALAAVAAAFSERVSERAKVRVCKG